MRRASETIIERIARMEWYFDTLLRHSPESIRTDPALAQMRNDLTVYYSSGQWLEDYTCDERGELPPELKRGVLSQDALYDLLCRLDDCE